MSEVQPSYNAGDSYQVATRKRKEDREQLRNEDAVKFVMGHSLGRHFVYKLMREAGLYRQPFAQGAATDFQCGRLDIALRLHALLETQAPNELLLMKAEYLEQRTKNNKEENNG